MDFKGMRWAGNIYQKFEAMCLEVEEVMYQDTVKYVENQVEKVGVSVKKFYSEVMQDLNPPSSVDPVKVAAGDLSLNLYAHTDTNKKPKSFSLDNPRELKKIKTRDESMSDLISEKLSSLSGKNDVTQFPPCKNTPAESCSAKNNRLGVHRRPIGIKRISRLERPSKISTTPTICSSEPGSADIVTRDMRERCAEAPGEKNATSPSDFVQRRDIEEVIANTALDTSNDCLVPDNIILSGSVEQTKDEPEPISSLGASVNDISSSGTGPSITTNSYVIEPNVELYDISDEGKNYQDWSSLNTSINTGDLPFQVQEATLSDEDDFGLEDVSNLEFAESVIEISDTFEKSSLEETCVFVEGHNLDFLLQGTKKPKSYKKKIREALSSKLRPTRKQGHTGNLRVIKNTEVAGSAAKADSTRERLENSNSLESEWEIL